MVPRREGVFSSLRMMDLEAPAAVEGGPPLEQSVVSNHSRLRLAVFISYIIRVISWAMRWARVVTGHWSKTCEMRGVRSREHSFSFQIPIFKKDKFHCSIPHPPIPHSCLVRLQGHYVLLHLLHPSLCNISWGGGMAWCMRCLCGKWKAGS